MAAHNDSAAMFDGLEDSSTLANFFGNEDPSSTEPSSSSVAATSATTTTGATATANSSNTRNTSPGSGAPELVPVPVPVPVGQLPQQPPNPQHLPDGEAAAAAAAGLAYYPVAEPNWTFGETPPFEDFENTGIPFDISPVSAQFPQTPWPIQTAVGPAVAHQQHPFPNQPLPHHVHPNQFPVAPGGAVISPIALDPEQAQNNFPFALAEGHIRPNPSARTLQALTPAQKESLRNIAMPAHLQYHSPKSEPSPQSSPSDKEKGDASSPEAHEPSKASSRKRKSSADEDDDDDDDLDHPVKKTAHNMIEKRYRTNLNDKIAALRDSVPSLRIMSKSARGEDTTEDREELHGLTPAHKLNKATVLSKATEYIRHLEKRNNRLLHENETMQQRIGAFEKLFMAGAMNGGMSPLQQPPTPIQFPHDARAYMTTPMATPGAQETQGMIPVPDEMKRILEEAAASGRPYPVPAQPQQNFSHNASMMRQQHIQQQQQQIQQNRWGESGPYFGKLMVGSLAGLMILEAARESEKSQDTTEGRGLFATPLNLLGSLVANTHFGAAGYSVSFGQLVGSLRLFLVLLLVGQFFVLPYFRAMFAPKSQKAEQQQDQKQAISGQLEPVPCLASPIDVRRKAWATSIQTVWVPRHSFFLEAAALILKIMKLSVRNLIGIRGYQMLTGLTEDQETARVKAWTIALDAQLAGGDVEINNNRLTLTLLASFTLPDTPLRLMLKALHVRVLAWRLFDSPRGVQNVVAAKWARQYWNQARLLYRLSRASTSSSSSSSSSQQDDNSLPAHLAELLEHECDEVLNDEVVQRAHNLAWNRPTTHGVTADIDGMSAVVVDPAVRSPMDAVAAWWSCLVLRQLLTTSLGDTTAAGADERKESGSLVSSANAVDEVDLALAVDVAPIGSNAQVRALVARACLSERPSGANIVDALEAMQRSRNPDKYPEYSNRLPPLIDFPTGPIDPDPDAKMALHCAMVAAHLRSVSPKDSALGLVDQMLRGPTDRLTLLGFSAALNLIGSLYQHPVARERCSGSIERLAGTLRIWIGGPSSDRCGLDQGTRHAMVQRCLAITKSIVGMESDPGYGSMSECDAAEDDSSSC